MASGQGHERGAHNEHSLMDAARSIMQKFIGQPVPEVLDTGGAVGISSGIDDSPSISWLQQDEMQAFTPSGCQSAKACISRGSNGWLNSISFRHLQRCRH